MAYINIRGAVVEREFSGGKGFAIAEKFEDREGNQRSKPFTVWFDEPRELPVGTVADFSGLYSDKIEKFKNDKGEDVHVIRRSINSVKVDNEVAPGGASAGGEAETPW